MLLLLLVSLSTLQATIEFDGKLNGEVVRKVRHEGEKKGRRGRNERSERARRRRKHNRKLINADCSFQVDLHNPSTKTISYNVILEGR